MKSTHTLARRQPLIESLEARQLFAGYKIVDFGPGSYSVSYADVIKGVNASGEAIGTLPIQSTGVGMLGYRGTSYGIGAPLQSLGGYNATATAINDAGVVIGNADTKKEANHIAEWTVSKKNKVTVKDLGSLNGGKGGGIGFTINASGQVGGSAMTKSGKQHAFLYSGGKMTDQGTLVAGGTSIVTSLSDNGIAVGFATDAQGNAQVVTFKKGVHQVTGLSGIPYVNTSGWIAAGSNVLEGKKLVSLGNLPGAILAPTVSAMNNKGQIVGITELTNRNTGFIWQNGVMTDLNTLIPANSGYRIDNVYGISSNGRIVAEGFKNNQAEIFELVPK